MKRLTACPPLRVPPRNPAKLDAEDDHGVFLDHWPAVEPVLLSLLNSLPRTKIPEKEKGVLICSVLSPDPRERSLAYDIVESLVERAQLNRDALIAAAVEYLLGDLDHYGVDLILALINSTEISEAEIRELYIPLLTQKGNDKIRREIITGVVDVFEYTTAESIFAPLLQQCRRFSSKDCLAAIEIAEGVLENVGSLSTAEARYLAQLLSVFLQQECQLTVERLALFFTNPEVRHRLSLQSAAVVEGLFSVTYRLSQVYWKKTDQVFVCEILQVLFELNPAVFDQALRHHNQARHLEQENRRLQAQAEGQAAAATKPHPTPCPAPPAAPQV